MLHCAIKMLVYVCVLQCIVKDKGKEAVPIVGVLCPDLTNPKCKLMLQDGVGGEWRSGLSAFSSLAHIIVCCTYVRTSS
jgi:hypothetical protein